MCIRDRVTVHFVKHPSLREGVYGQDVVHQGYILFAGDNYGFTCIRAGTRRSGQN